MEPTQVKKKILENETSDVERLLATERDELVELRRMRTIETEAFNKTRRSLEKKIQQLKEQVALLESRLEPQAQRLQDWETDLTAREERLEVVVRRYKRLYEKFGANFRLS